MAIWVPITSIDNTVPFKQTAWKENTCFEDIWFAEISGLTDTYNWSGGVDAANGRYTYHRFNCNQYTCNYLPQYDSYDDGYGVRGVNVGYPQNYGYAARDDYRTDLQTEIINGEVYYVNNLEDWLNWVPLYAITTTRYGNEGDIMVDIEFGTYTVTPDSLTFAASGGSNNITIEFDDPWTASTQENWIGLSQTTGNSGTSIITISVPENVNPITRNGVITVTNGSKNVLCTITQNKYPVLLYKNQFYRNGNRINKMCRNGNTIYKNLNF